MRAARFPITCTIGTATSEESNRPKWNVDARPFFPSSPTERVPNSIIQTSSRENGVGRAMSYSAALKSTKPRRVPNPVVETTPAVETIEPQSSDKESSTAQPLSQPPVQARKNKPSKSIPLAEFVLLKLTDQEKTKAEGEAPSGARFVGKQRLQPQKETQKPEKQISAAAAVPRGNILDSSVPVLHKGKQRENPRKKYTRMKKVILNERKQRGENGSRQQDCTADGVDKEQVDNPSSSFVEATGKSEETSAVATAPARVQKRGTRAHTKFRDNVLSKDLDQRVIAVISELGRFQDRLYSKDPDKARTKKRLVYGLREVHKLLKVEKVKCVVFAPNIESASGEGGLDEMITDMLDMCRQQNVPYFFALTKMKLGYVSHKHSPVSCAGILNYHGADEQYKAMLECASQTKEAFIIASEMPADLLSDFAEEL